MTAKKYQDYMYQLIDRVVKEIGPREPCSEAEKKTARFMAEEWKPICDSVELESFKCHPAAFLGFLPFATLFYLAALPLYWLFPPVSFVLSAIGLSMLLFQFVRYKEMLDRFFPEKTGENVIGIIKPKGEVRRRVIMCGHIDSAYEFNLWYFLKNAAIPVMIIAFAGVLLLAGISAAKTVAWFTGTAGLPVYQYLGIAAVALYPFVSLFQFFHTYTPVPGAMDDMAGVAVAAGVGRYLNDARANGEFFPEHTEVHLIGMACEEAGLRGARRYVARHREEMKKIPTHTIMFDGIYDEKFLKVVTREICTGAKHDPELIKMALDSAAERGWKMGRDIIPLGASDATEFSRAGFPCTTILCQDTSKLVFNYHTRHDVIEHIRPESLTVCLQIALDMLEKLDKKA